MARITPADAGGPEVCAFLDTIAHSEIGEALLAISDDGYNVLVGSTPEKPLLFFDYSRHPRILNEEFNSTAAGRDQIIWPTWLPLMTKLKLPDFGPISQDRAAIELLRQGGAIPHILAGSVSNAVEIVTAIALEKEVWASFPGNNYGQHQNKMDSLVTYFETALTRYV